LGKSVDLLPVIIFDKSVHFCAQFKGRLTNRFSPENKRGGPRVVGLFACLTYRENFIFVVEKDDYKKYSGLFDPFPC
tara:strand:- start:41 stop:271 length:231 start_codon:yes stop_codon:yes gene_type:complete